MKTRRAPGCNRQRQGDTDEWLKVRSLQLEGERGLSGYHSALCVRLISHTDLLDHTVGA